MKIQLRTANMHPCTPLVEEGLCETDRREGIENATIVDGFKLDIDPAPIWNGDYSSTSFKIGRLVTCPFSSICPAGAGCSNPDVLATEEDAANLIERFPQSVNMGSLARIVRNGGTVMPIQLSDHQRENSEAPDSIPDEWVKKFGSSEE